MSRVTTNGFNETIKKGIDVIKVLLNSIFEADKDWDLTSEPFTLSILSSIIFA